MTRLDSTADSGGGPTEVAVILRSLARHAVTVPLAETDLLAGWLASHATLQIPDGSPATVALGGGDEDGTRVRATVAGVPYAAEAETVVLALSDGDRLLVAVADPADLRITGGHNAGGEPRPPSPSTAPRSPSPSCPEPPPSCAAAALGALRADHRRTGCGVEFSVEHTRTGRQFGRPLSAFGPSNAPSPGWPARSNEPAPATNLAVAAAADFGSTGPRTDYAVTVAKVTLGQVVSGGSPRHINCTEPSG